jgi:hypothetical protein
MTRLADRGARRDIPTATLIDNPSPNDSFSEELMSTISQGCGWTPLLPEGDVLEPSVGNRFGRGGDVLGRDTIDDLNHGEPRIGSAVAGVLSA